MLGTGMYGFSLPSPVFYSLPQQPAEQKGTTVQIYSTNTAHVLRARPWTAKTSAEKGGSDTDSGSLEGRDLQVSPPRSSSQTHILFDALNHPVFHGDYLL